MLHSPLQRVLEILAHSGVFALDDVFNDFRLVGLGDVEQQTLFFGNELGVELLPLQL